MPIPGTVNICYNDFVAELTETRTPLIVAFVADMMSSIRIESTAQKLGFSVRNIDDISKIAPGVPVDSTPLQAEPVFGPEALLFDRLTRWHPVLIIFDLSNDSVPWKEWIPKLKSSPATKRIPVICFGPHTDTEALKTAAELAVDSVNARSRFFSSMPSIIQKYASIENTEAIISSCQEQLPETAKTGFIAFNRGDYFEAHEHLEDAWKEELSAGRGFYRACIQVAVAYLQIERSNYRGALKMLLRARGWFHPLPEICQGVDVKSLQEDAEKVYQSLVQLGPERIGDFDHSLLQPIRMVEEG